MLEEILKNPFYQILNSNIPDPEKKEKCSALLQGSSDIFTEDTIAMLERFGEYVWHLDHGGFLSEEIKLSALADVKIAAIKTGNAILKNDAYPDFSNNKLFYRKAETVSSFKERSVPLEIIALDEANKALPEAFSKIFEVTLEDITSDKKIKKIENVFVDFVEDKRLETKKEANQIMDYSLELSNRGYESAKEYRKQKEVLGKAPGFLTNIFNPNAKKVYQDALNNIQALDNKSRIYSALYKII